MLHLSATPLYQYLLGTFTQMKRQRVKTVCGKTVAMARITCRPERTQCPKCAAIVPVTTTRDEYTTRYPAR